MPVVTRRAPWRTKPPLGYGVNPLHPLARDLLGLWLFNEGGGFNAYDLSQWKSMGVIGTGFLWRSNPFGESGGGLDHPSADTTLIDAGTLGSYNLGQSSFTMACRYFGRTAGTGTRRLLMGKVVTAGTAVFMTTSDVSSNDIRVESTGWSGSDGLIGGGGVLVLNQWHTYATTFDGTAKTLTLYRDGVSQGTSSPTGTGPSLGTTTFTMGYNSASGMGGVDGVYAWAGVWRRVLSVPELMLLTYDQYSYFDYPRGVRVKSAGGTAYTQSLTGAVTGSASLVKAGAKPLTGSLTGLGALLKVGAKPVSGAITPIGLMARQVQKGHTDSLAGSGSLVRSVSKGLAATLTVSTTLAKSAARALTGAVTLSGSLVKTCGKALTGAVTGSGVLAKSVLKAVTGTLTASGVLTSLRLVLLVLTATLTVTGTLTKATAKGLIGALGMAGSLAKAVRRALTGLLSLTGILTAGAPRVPPITELRDDLGRTVNLTDDVLRTKNLRQNVIHQVDADADVE